MLSKGKLVPVYWYVLDTGVYPTEHATAADTLTSAMTNAEVI